MDPEEPRWLDDQEREAWLTLAGLLLRLPGALDAQLQRDAGVTHFDYLCLAMLSEADGRVLRTSELAAITNASLSRLSHVVSKLERRGWVERLPCPGDGRTTMVQLTEQGWAKVERTAPGHVEHVRSLVVDPLTPQQLRQLKAAGQRILQRLTDEERSA